MKKIKLLTIIIALMLLITSCNTANTNQPTEKQTEQTTTHIHNFEDWEVTIEPTLTEFGQKVRYCACGEKQTEVIAKLKGDSSTTTEEPTEDVTTKNPDDESTDVSTEEPTTEAPTEAPTEEITTEEPTTEEPTTEEATSTPPVASAPTANRTHFSDSLSTNGPLTEWALPSTGTPKVLVVPVNLKSSNKTSAMLQNIEIAFNGTQAQTGWYSVSEYYYVSSYGKLDIDFVVLNEWFTPSRSKSYYESYYDNDGYYGSTLILDEFLRAYDSKIDFSDYDSNGDGIIDAIWLIYNCAVNYNDDSSDFWAYVYETPSEIEVDGVYASFYGYAGTDFMFEQSDVYPCENIIIDAHTYIHETGHLMGLDDYYDYNPDVGPEGGFYWADMMDANIGDHSSINKLLLGWIDPIVITGEGGITIDLNSFAESGDVILIANHSISSIYDEYILIEFYTPTLLNENDEPIYPDGYSDSAYGIRVLHIDARINYDSFGEVDYNNDNGYVTGFLYDNSDEDKLFVDTLYCELIEEYATDDILFTPTSKTFASLYSDYEYHDGTVIGFDIIVNSMTNSSANITIVIA